MKLPAPPLLLLMVAMFFAPVFGGRLSLDAATDTGAIPVMLEHLLIAVPIVAAVLLVAFRNTVIMLPAPRLLVPLTLFWLALFVSVIGSEFRHDTILEFCRWTVYCLAIGVCVSAVGRSDGPRLMVAAWFAGCCVMAMFGAWEYLQNSATAPNWRIFAGWQNPNAAASLLSMALPAGVALSMSFARSRALGTTVAVGCALILAALWLTASKGGLASALVGVVAFVGASMIQKRSRPTAEECTPLVVLGVATAAILLLLYAPARSAEPGSSSRVFAAGAEAEQSVGFRRQLWIDTAKMAGENPVAGVGIGAFSPAFPRYSTTQGSALAHNSYLQLAAETGAFGVLSLFAFIGVWITFAWRQNPGVPSSENILRNGIVASVVAGGANAFVESSFSYFGFGVSVFALIGLALLLAPDGARPERSTMGARLLPASLLSFIVIGYMAMTAANDRGLFHATVLIRNGEYDRALNQLRDVSRQPLDPTGRTLLSRLLLSRAETLESAGRHGEARGDRDEAKQLLEEALRLRPTAANHALYADALAALKLGSQAEASYGRAASLAPASPLYKRKLFQFFVSIGDVPRATTVASELVEMESSNYFTIRALPWLISTDTIEARMFLADLAKEASDRTEEIASLEGAYNILVDYRKKTYGEIKRMTGGVAELYEFELGGQSLRIASIRFDELKQVARRLTSLYRVSGRDADAIRIDDEVIALEEL